MLPTNSSSDPDFSVRQPRQRPLPARRAGHD